MRRLGALQPPLIKLLLSFMRIYADFRCLRYVYEVSTMTLAINVLSPVSVNYMVMQPSRKTASPQRLTYCILTAGIWLYLTGLSPNPLSEFALKVRHVHNEDERGIQKTTKTLFEPWRGSRSFFNLNSERLPTSSKQPVNLSTPNGAECS